MPIRQVWAVKPSILLLLVHHRLEIGKGVKRGDTHVFLRILTRDNGGAILIRFGVLRVFVIVTKQAQQLPVTAIFRVIGVIVVDMVNREFTKI